jgi:hypothetical protein
MMLFQRWSVSLVVITLAAWTTTRQEVSAENSNLRRSQPKQPETQGGH